MNSDVLFGYALTMCALPAVSTFRYADLPSDVHARKWASESVTGWVVEPATEPALSEVEVSRKRTVCPLRQFNSIAKYFPTGAGKVLLSPQSGGIENGISLTG